MKLELFLNLEIPVLKYVEKHQQIVHTNYLIGFTTFGQQDAKETHHQQQQRNNNHS